MPALYLLGKRLLGPVGGFVGALLLATWHAHIHFSRIVSVAYTLETLLIPLELYFFISGLQDRRRWRLALAGLIIGAHLGLYVSAPIVLLLLLVYLAIVALAARPVLAGTGAAWRPLGWACSLRRCQSWSTSGFIPRNSSPD